MTGYSMPASTGAISSGDTLNQAVGKLEKAVSDADISNVVHKTGNEIVQGVKTFKNAHAWETGGNVALSSIQIQSTELERNVAPISYSRFAGVVILDKNATSDLDFVNRLGALEFGKNTDSDSYVYIKAYNPNTTDGEVASIVAGWDNQSRAYGTAPSTDSTRTNGNDILTRNWIPQDARIVHTTGNETIAGDKTFTGEVISKNSSFTKGTAPSGSKYDVYYSLKDSAGVTATGLYYSYYADKTATSSIVLYNPFTNNTSDWSYIGIGCDTNQTYYGYAPSTSTSRTNGADILTRDWIPNDTRIVHTTDSETISGNKTFNSALYFNNLGIATFRLKYGDDVNLPATLPTATRYAGLGVYNSSGDILLYDYHRIDSSNGNVAKVWQLHSSRDLSDSEHFEFIYVKASDSFYLTGPAEFAANDNSAKIPNTSWIRSATGNFACNAATATKLATARTIRTNLASTSTASFDGSANVAPGVTGTLPVANGGTGLTSLDTFVRTTGDQTVGGTKTFSSSVNITRINPYLTFKETDANRNANVDGYQGIWFTDKNDKVFGAVLTVEETVSGQSKPNIMTELKTYGYGSTDVQRIIVFEQENGSSTIWSFQPRGGINDIRLGNAGNRWKQLYATTSSIDTSDERMKSDINVISDEVLDAWDNIEWYTFKMNDAISEKGIDSARIHSGLIAQRIISVFEQHLLDPFKYSFICYDSWEGKPASYDKEGNLLTPEEKSGDEYSLRYAEALCIEAAYQRRENARLKKRVSDLEDRLAALELRLGSE